MTALVSKYQSEYSVEERCAACEQVRGEFPDCVPIVAEQLGARQGKAHFLALPREATVKQLQATVRKALKLSSQAPLALAIGDCTPSATALVGNLYDHCRQDDGFLYVMYVLEASMGCHHYHHGCAHHTFHPCPPVNPCPPASGTGWSSGFSAGADINATVGLNGGAFCV